MYWKINLCHIWGEVSFWEFLPLVGGVLIIWDFFYVVNGCVWFLLWDGQCRKIFYWIRSWMVFFFYFSHRYRKLRPKTRSLYESFGLFQKRLIKLSSVKQCKTSVAIFQSIACKKLIWTYSVPRQLVSRTMDELVLVNALHRHEQTKKLPAPRLLSNAIEYDIKERH